MSESINLTKIALLIFAVLFSGITIVVVVMLFMMLRHGKVLAQVEKQGNSSALEQKRLIAAALQTIATVKPSPENKLKASDAKTAYMEAEKQAEQNSR